MGDMDESRVPLEESESPLEDAEEEASRESESIYSSSIYSSSEEFEEEDLTEDEFFDILTEARSRVFNRDGAGDVPTGGIFAMHYEQQPIVSHGHGDHGDNFFRNTERLQIRREDITADVSLREQVESESVEARLTLKQRLRALRFHKFKILRKPTRVQPM
ncbi:hypothetical protein AMEX_G9078 [Astyanax mexicanus]|uniref:Uncharacterized protein n=1 Tax=Astyanax mexicanus TaxID=7994 RepID=A0A8T2M415_ASTMX|nr:hypothetical protein AMEX_G9078 [Astyanax mexicanus]